jgi:enoyl-CoA hydratase/carnithine racemase
VDQSDIEDPETYIRVKDNEGVRSVTLNRSEKLNAMTGAMYDRLTEVLVGAAVDPTVACVLLSAEGRAFCSGRDLAELSRPPTSVDGRRHGSIPCIDELIGFPKPIVCAVNGLAVGFGATLPLHCDLVVASTEARFKFPFVELGLAGESASTVTLPARIGYQEAARLLFTSAWVGADEAESLGLVLKIVQPASLMAESFALAAQISKMPADAVRATNRLLLAGRIEAVRSAFAREIEAYGVLLDGPSNRDAMSTISRVRGSDTED